MSESVFLSPKSIAVVGASTQFFVPLITYSLPSLTAKVFILDASDPDWGSERENAPSFSPDANLLRYLSFI